MKSGLTYHGTTIQYQVTSDCVDCWGCVESGRHDQRKGDEEAAREGEEEDSNEIDDEDFVCHSEWCVARPARVLKVCLLFNIDDRRLFQSNDRDEDEI